MKKAIMVIALLALVSMMIAPVMAETLTGTLGSSGAVIDGYYVRVVGGGVWSRVTSIQADNIEYTSGATTLLLFAPTGSLFHYTNATLTGNTTTVILKHGATTIGNGVIGYQRVFAGAPPVEQNGGYMWISLYSYNITGLSGREELTLEYDLLDGLTVEKIDNEVCGNAVVFDDAPTSIGYLSFCRGFHASGEYIYSKHDTSTATYNATKPSGLGITGSVQKTIGMSQASIYDGINGSLIASEYTLSGATFNFNVPKQSVIVSILTGLGSRFNSSILFAVAVPTVTPTPAPTIPPGYIQTEIATIDVYGARISGTNINILDNEAGVWTNSTNDADGLSSVITLPYHTLNVYGSYTQVANEYADNSLIGINTGYDGGIRFYLILYPYYADTGAGNTRLYVTVMESAGLAPISNVLVKVGILNNATLVGYTSSSGVQAFTVPNQTVLHITAEKSGYITNGIVINSGPGTTAFANIVLDRRTVTPTVTGTPLPNEITVRPSYSPGCDPAAYDAAICNANKDSDMMNQIRDAGPGLIALAIIATIIGLIKLMTKK